MANRSKKFNPNHCSIIAIIEDGSCHYLSPSALNVLLSHNLVLKFERSDGWVTVGVDPIRISNRFETDQSYFGPDRRSDEINWS